MATEKQIELELTPPFEGAHGHAYDYHTKIRANIKLLFDGLQQYDTKESVNNPEAEEDIQKKFKAFLIGCEFHMAIEDFKELLEESNQTPRDDGTTGWHHQFSQILLFIDQVKRGKISLDQLEEHGGLETCLRIIMRHDSLEDFGLTPAKFKELQEQKIEDKHHILTERGIIKSDNLWHEREPKNIDILMNGLRLMSKKTVAVDESGNPIYNEKKRKFKTRDLFETDIDFIGNMLDDPYASPVVWIFKSGDGTHNLSSMLNAPKFDALKRKKYANRREDMYGSRHGFPERAQEQWPTFKESIKEADHLMGAVIYTNFGFLTYVDQKDAYPRNPKYKEGDTIYPLGIKKYMEGATAYSVPRAFSPLHNLLDDIQIIAHDESNPEKARRARLYLEYSVKPALEKYKIYFPKLFNDAILHTRAKPITQPATQ